MSNTIVFILDILKITIPALMVFLAVYFIIKKFFNAQVMTQQLQIKQDQQQNALQIKLQAYERLTLFCERLDIMNLVMRLRMSAMTNADLHKSMLISIQKEYEHNIVQQIYISEKLWNIISIARENVIGIIEQAYSKVTPENNAQELTKALQEGIIEMKSNPIRTAISAINKEAKTIL